MSLEAILLLALMVAALVLVAFGAVVSAPRGPLPARPRRTRGLLVRVACPAAGVPAHVRIGISPRAGHLVVSGCERYPDRALDCDRGCFQEVLDNGAVAASA